MDTSLDPTAVAAGGSAGGSASGSASGSAGAGGSGVVAPAAASARKAGPKSAAITLSDSEVIVCETAGVTIRLQNVVATVDLGTELDLKTIAVNTRNAEYNPRRFAAVIMRLREPKTTALVFKSGKMVVTGAKSPAMAQKAARTFAKLIGKHGFKVKKVTSTSVKVQNMVGTCDVKFPIRLEGLSLQHVEFCSYEPELFPGLIYRLARPKVVLIIFVSGKVVLTGAKREEDLKQAFERMYPTLSEFKK